MSFKSEALESVAMYGWNHHLRDSCFSAMINLRLKDFTFFAVCS